MRSLFALVLFFLSVNLSAQTLNSTHVIEVFPSYTEALNFMKYTLTEAQRERANLVPLLTTYGTPPYLSPDQISYSVQFPGLDSSEPKPNPMTVAGGYRPVVWFIGPLDYPSCSGGLKNPVATGFRYKADAIAFYETLPEDQKSIAFILSNIGTTNIPPPTPAYVWPFHMVVTLSRGAYCF